MKFPWLRITRRAVLGGLAATPAVPAFAWFPRGGGAGTSPGGAILTVTTPVDPISGQSLTRPTGSLWNNGTDTEWPFAHFTGVINTANYTPNINDYLDIVDAAGILNGGNPVTNPWYWDDSSTAPGTAPSGIVTVHVPSVAGFWYNNADYFSATGYPLPLGETTNWVLRLRNGVTNAVIASVPIKVDMLKRNNPPFGWKSGFGNPGVGVIDVNPEIASGSGEGGAGATVCSGTTVGLITLIGASQNFASPIPINSLLLQYTIDNVDIPGGPVLGPAVSNAEPFSWTTTFDSTKYSDGTHALGARVVDYTGGIYIGGPAANDTPYAFAEVTFPIVINNSGGSLADVYTGAVMMPLIADGAGPDRFISNKADFITFPGTAALPLRNTVAAIPTPQSGDIPPAYLDSRYNTPTNALLLRDSTNFFLEPLSGLISGEYMGYVRYFDNGLGGVFAGWSYPEAVGTLEADQAGANIFQPLDGGRGDCLEWNICNGVEGYDSSGTPLFWLLAESTGRIYRKNYDGSSVTLAGYTANRDLVSYSSLTNNVFSETQIDTKLTSVGTILSLGTTSTPSFGNLRGCHDVKYDPRDSTFNTVFVANVLAQTIIKITDLLSGSPQLVRYAGQYRGLLGNCFGDPNFLGDFQDGVATEFIAGSTVATFTGTISGGVLTISGTYTGSTNLKGCPISWSGNPNTDTGNLITTNISGSGVGSTWNTNVAGSVGPVAMTASTQVALFNKPYSLEIADGTGIDAAGTLYIADFQGMRLRKIDLSGNVTTLFGNQDNVSQGIGWFPVTVGPFTASSMSWSGGLLHVQTSAAVIVTQGTGQTQSFTTPKPIAPYWTVQINGTGNSALDFGSNNGLVFRVSPTSFVSDSNFMLEVASNPGTISSPGTVTVYLMDAFTPMTPTYRPWNAGMTSEAYFPWIARLTWSSENPNAGTSIIGGSTARHLVAAGPWNMAVLDIDLENQQVRTIGALGGQAHSRVVAGNAGAVNPVNAGVNFLMIDCNSGAPGGSSVGGCGPINDVVIADQGASLNPNTFFKVSWDGDAGAINWLFQQAGAPTPMFYGIQPITGGHYPWMALIGRKQGRALTSGTSDIGVYGWRIFNPAYDVVQNKELPGTNFDSQAITRAFSKYGAGTVGASFIAFSWLPGMFPWGSRPSFYCTHGAQFQNFLGPQSYSGGAPVGNNTDSFDALGANVGTDLQLAEFIQGGFGGAEPRPEFTGDDLSDMIYAVRRLSLTGSFAYPASAIPQLADFATDCVAPIISSPSAGRLNPTSIIVSWTTDKPTFGFAAAGFASGQGSDYPYHIWELEEWGGGQGVAVASGPNNSYGTTHSVIISGLSPAVATYWVVMAKDIAGNNAWFAGVSPVSGTWSGVPADGTAIYANTGGTLQTLYGIWDFGDQYAPPGPDGNIYRFARLNGREILNTGGVEGNPLAFRRLVVDKSGNLFGLTLSSIWNVWESYSWQYDGNYPGSGTTYDPLPPSQVTPPFTPSPDGTSITGGTGSLTSIDGVWGFGSVNGSGWNLQLNGINVGFGGGLPFSTIEINSHGQVWGFRTDTSSWYLWLEQVLVSEPAPTSLPIPIAIKFRTELPTFPHTAALGTRISTVSVTMSDGSEFSGTYAVGPNPLGHTYATTSGNDVVISVTPVPDYGGGNAEFFTVSATQNGFTISKQLNVVIP